MEYKALLGEEKLIRRNQLNRANLYYKKGDILSSANTAKQEIKTTSNAECIETLKFTMRRSKSKSSKW